MDPLSAISLAGNIIGFIDFGAKLGFKAYEIYSNASGTTEDDETLAAVVRDLKSLCKSLESRTPTMHMSPDERALDKIATQCQEVAQDLLDLLEEFKAGDDKWYRSKWPRKSRRGSARAAWKSITKRSKKEDLERRLTQCSGLLDKHMANLARSETTTRLDQLIRAGKSNRAELTALRRQIEITRQGVEVASISTEAVKQLTHLLDKSEESILSIRRAIILDAIYVHGLQDRFEQIRDHCEKTLDWVYEDADTAWKPHHPVREDPNRPPYPYTLPTQHVKFSEISRLEKDLLDEMGYRRTDFSRDWKDWLVTGTGIFHISGKLGSGKSTFMKFLYTSPKTKQVLEQWSEQNQLVICGFFFWNSGTVVQKSMNGLCRGLLHQILLQCPSLVPLLFPDPWLDTEGQPWGAHHLRLSDSEIRGAFEELLSGRYLEKYRLAIFIDGLDEFESNVTGTTHAELVNILNSWNHTLGSKLRLCVSSKDWPVFNQKLSSQHLIALQKLTIHDIYLVVRQRLAIMEFSKTSQELDYMTEMLVRKSVGMFLWTIAVLANMEAGIHNGDDIMDDIKRRIVMMPEMDHIYEQILNACRPSDREYLQQIMDLMLDREIETNKPTPALYAWLIDPVRFDKFIADSGYDPTAHDRLVHGRINFPLEPMLRKQVEDTVNRAAGRSYGLLEGCYWGNSKEPATLKRCLAFVHRSALHFVWGRNRAADRRKDHPSRFLEPWCIALTNLFKLLAYTGGLAPRNFIERPLCELCTLLERATLHCKDRTLPIYVLECLRSIDSMKWEVERAIRPLLQDDERLCTAPFNIADWASRHGIFEYIISLKPYAGSYDDWPAISDAMDSILHSIGRKDNPTADITLAMRHIKTWRLCFKLGVPHKAYRKYTGETWGEVFNRMWFDMADPGVFPKHAMLSLLEMHLENLNNPPICLISLPLELDCSSKLVVLRAWDIPDDHELGCCYPSSHMWAPPLLISKESKLAFLLGQRSGKMDMRDILDYVGLNLGERIEQLLSHHAAYWVDQRCHSGGPECETESISEDRPVDIFDEPAFPLDGSLAHEPHLVISYEGDLKKLDTTVSKDVPRYRLERQRPHPFLVKPQTVI